MRRGKDLAVLFGEFFQFGCFTCPTLISPLPMDATMSANGNWPVVVQPISPPAAVIPRCILKKRLPMRKNTLNLSFIPEI